MKGRAPLNRGKAHDDIENKEAREWFDRTVESLSKGIYEKDEVITMTLLAVLSGQSVFLYGPPGTAKSLVARRVSCAFQDASYFENLMQRFSTPEEVFGPVDISELKKGNYVRRTESYLPTADIAFLDEIWKSSSAILNTLLTIVNERKFKNGSKVENVPLKAIISASNEFPQPNCGLEALYDRFIIRMVVGPATDRKNFENIISSDNVPGFVKVDSPLSTADWEKSLRAIRNIGIKQEVFASIDKIRRSIDRYNDENGSDMIYISDRRWQKAMFILKTAAYYSGHSSVECMDVLILKHCLWSSTANKHVLDRFIEDSIELTNFDYIDNLATWTKEYDELKAEIDETFNGKKRDDIIQSGDVRSYIVDFDGSLDNYATVRQAFIKCTDLDRAIEAFNLGSKKYGQFDIYAGSTGNYGCMTCYYELDGTEYQGKYRVVSVDLDTITVECNFQRSEIIRYVKPTVSSTAKMTYRRALAERKTRLEDIMDSTNKSIDALDNFRVTPFVTRVDTVAMSKSARSVLEQMKSCMEDLESLERQVGY